MKGCEVLVDLDRCGEKILLYLLDVVVAQSAAILKLLAGENQTLLVGWNSFLVLNLGLDIVDGIG